MSHENSETIQGEDGRWYNVNGQTREWLAPRFPFERDSYDTVEDAVDAARRRSEEHGRQPPAPAPDLGGDFGGRISGVVSAVLAGRMRPNQLRRREPLPRQPDRPGQGAPAPPSEPVPPLRLMPGNRPMSVEDEDRLLEGWEQNLPLQAGATPRSVADTMPLLPPPVEPELIPLADYLQARLLEIGSAS